MSEIIQSGGSFSSWLGNLKIDQMWGLVSNIASNAALGAINNFERRISSKGATKGFTLFISNVDTDDIKIIKSLEDSGVLINGVTEIVKHEIEKKKEGRFYSTFGCFIGTTCDFFSGKICRWKSSQESRKRIYG